MSLSRFFSSGEGRACRGRTHAGPVWTSRAESLLPLFLSGRAALVAAVPTPGPFERRALSHPPPLFLRFQCVIKSHPWPEPSSPETSSPRNQIVWATKGRTFAKPCTSVSREASIRAISGSGTFNGRRLTTEYTERPAAVTEHTECVNRDFGIQCFQCAAKRLPCVLWIVCGGFTTDNTDTGFARHGSTDSETSISSSPSALKCDTIDSLTVSF